MAGDFSKPVTADLYGDVLAEVRELCADLSKLLDGTGTANIPTGAIRWSSGNSRFEVFDGTSWSVLTAKMAMNVDQLDGYDAGNASGNIPVSNGTRCVGLNADKVDGLEASALLQVANNLADLADAATARGNLGLGTVAVENVAPVAKGGTGSTTAEAARTALGLGDAATNNTATQAEAEAGALDTVVMTPLKSKQQFDDRLAGFNANGRHTSFSGDLDTITYNSALVVGVSICTNYPSDMLGWGFMVTHVHTVDTYVRQTIYSFAQLVQEAYIWTRQRYNGVWRPWVPVGVNMEIDTGGGDYLAADPTVFTSSGTYTVPADVTKVVVQVCGGGGGSGGMYPAQGAYGQAGGPGGVITALVPVTSGASIAVTVGNGGTAGVSGGATPAGTGGTSSFGSYVSATGGPGGQGKVSGSAAYYEPKSGVCSVSSGVIILNNNYSLGNPASVALALGNGPASLTLNTTHSQAGKLYGGGASYRYASETSAGLAGANGIVRVWPVEG